MANSNLASTALFLIYSNGLNTLLFCRAAIRKQQITNTPKKQGPWETRETASKHISVRNIYIFLTFCFYFRMESVLSVFLKGKNQRILPSDVFHTGLRIKSKQTPNKMLNPLSDKGKKNPQNLQDPVDNFLFWLVLHLPASSSCFLYDLCKHRLVFYS